MTTIDVKIDAMDNGRQMWNGCEAIRQYTVYFFSVVLFLFQLASKQTKQTNNPIRTLYVVYGRAIHTNTIKHVLFSFFLSLSGFHSLHSNSHFYLSAYFRRQFNAPQKTPNHHHTRITFSVLARNLVCTNKLSKNISMTHEYI